MKKIMKIIGVLVALLVLVAVGLLIAAKILITPERVRQVVIPRAEEQLNRPVSIGDIDVRLFSGIVISDFRVGSKDEPEDFVSAKSLILRYQFWPLLRGTVIVDEVRLISPDIRVVRNEDGTFNFSDLLDEEARPERVEVEVDETDGPPLDLLVREISISGGRLVFIDRMVDREYHLTDLMASVTDFSLEQAFPFDLSVSLDDAPIHINGTLNPETNHVSAAVRIQNLDVAAFMPYAPDDMPIELTGMKLSVDIKANANEEAVDTSGRISLSDIDLVLAEMPDAPIEKARVSLDYDVAIDLVSENISISSANADINGIGLAASGRILSYGSEPSLDISARLPMISLQEIIAAVPQALVQEALEMQPAGRIGAEIHLKGSPDKPEELLAAGEISLEKISVRIEELTPEINGVISLGKDSVSSDNLTANLAGDLVRIKFAANNLMGEIINVTHTITADGLDIDRLLAAVGVEQEDAPPVDEIPEEPVEIGPFDLPLAVYGEVQVAKAVFKGLPIENVDLQYQLKDNIMTVERLRGNVAGGTISGNARAELNREPIAYSGNIAIDRTRAENFLSAFFPAAADTVFGSLSLNADVSGEGTTWEVISQALTAQSDFNIADGRLTGESLAGGLATFLKTERLQVLDFDSLKGNVEMKDGEFQIDTQFDSEEIRMAPEGTIGIDGDLAMVLDLRVAPGLASRIGSRDLVAQLEKTEEGWTILPIKLSGTVRSPKFDIDVSAITDRLKERGREELQKQLQERVLDRFIPQKQEKEDSSDTSDTKEQAPIEKKVEDKLRRLLR